jgi:hypothetical protein
MKTLKILQLLSTFFVMAVFAQSATAQQLGPAKFMMSLKVKGEAFEGSPLAWSDARIDFITRDGQWIDFKPSDATHFRRINNSFRAMERTQMRNRLQNEFGSEYRVTDDGNYIVVRHRNLDRRWDTAFNELYRSYFRFFRARGFSLNKPFFPLVAIVLPNRLAFVQHAAKNQIRVVAGMVGYYFQKTNRVVMFWLIFSCLITLMLY